MEKNRRRLDTLFYKIADLISAMLAWALFFGYRKVYIEGNTPDWGIVEDANLLFGVLIIPVCWRLFYELFDRYKDIYRLSRLATLARTFFLSFLGVVFLFFALILDDVVQDYTTYYQSFTVLFFLHFGITAIVRMILLTRASRRLKRGLVSFRTLIIGGDQKAAELYEEISSREKRLGYHFLGFIDTNGKSTNVLAQHLSVLGKIEDLRVIIEEEGVEEVIIAIETSEHNRLQEILNILFDFDERVLVKIIPDMYDIMLGSVQMTSVYGAVLIEIKQDLMPKWQRLIKRLIDFGVSLVALIVLGPLYLYIATRVRFSSDGPIFFAQERIGLNGKPFLI
ncbi:MAG: sugar transferase, partial [Bacteroidota bacterium]